MQKSNPFTRLYRISRIVIHTISGLSIAAFVLPVIKQNTRLILIRWWCGGLLRAFNIKVITYGERPSPDIQGVMFVANHISWSDIHALNSLIPLRFIAKSDIKSWPVFGYLVTKANTLFIDRDKRHEAGRIVEITAESLMAGDNLCFFPEGTTTDGSGAEGALALPFKSSVLQAAISANTHVWPVAIRYVNEEGGINTEIAYAGETTLVESMQKVLKQKNPVIELHFLEPINSVGQNRRDLTQRAYDAIVTRLTS
ncbi:MAG TPA: lysophospholipid acyltransferase family protein [Methylotenera sp.]|nr:lysophospholipid acyltransferase family protein [Methylotenera sp.]HPV44561.1 lysophospholipid acyltransferase family protein [Methylotenera sp.]